MRSDWMAVERGISTSSAVMSFAHAMAHAQLVGRLLDNALGVLQIFALCRPIGNVHGYAPIRVALISKDIWRAR